MEFRLYIQLGRFSKFLHHPEYFWRCKQRQSLDGASLQRNESIKYSHEHQLHKRSLEKIFFTETFDKVRGHD